MCVVGEWGARMGKALLQVANYTLGPDATLNTEYIKIRFAYRRPN